MCDVCDRIETMLKRVEYDALADDLETTNICDKCFEKHFKKYYNEKRKLRTSEILRGTIPKEDW